MHYRSIVTGFALLLCASFFDSLRGPLLPVLSHQLGLSYEKVSLFLVVGYFAAMAAGRLLIPLLERYGLHPLTFALCFLAPVAAAFVYQLQGLATLIVLGILVACTSNCLGSVSNIFVLEGTDHKNRGRFYGLLHAFFGLGSQSAPFFLGVVLAAHGDWRWLLVTGGVYATLLALWIRFGLTAPTKVIEEKPAAPMPFRFLSIQGLIVFAFASYVAAEVLTSMWMVAYLVEAHHMTVEAATPYATGFFVCMTVTRVLCFVLHGDQMEKILIVGGLVAGVVCLVLGLGGRIGFLPFAGLVGPFFPLVLARVTRFLPREAPALTIRAILSGQGALAVCHFGMGWLATTYGLTIAYRAPALVFVIAILSTCAYLLAERDGLKGLKAPLHGVSSAS